MGIFAGIPPVAPFCPPMNNSFLFTARTRWLRLNAPIDRPLMFLTATLLAYATFIIASASPQRVTAHLANLAVGISCLFVAAHITPQRLRNLPPSVYVAGLVLLVAVALLGDISKGAQRWLNPGFTRVQPSEILKIAAPLMLAWFYFQRDEGLRQRDHLAALGLLLLPVLLIARQPALEHIPLCIRHIGMVTGLLPVVGVPLPFMSHGGTALVILCISLGILMSVAHGRNVVREP